MPSSNTPQVAINDIGTAEDFLAAVDATIKYFNDGDIVEGTVVKVDHDEVLLDIGYKTEGVIPSRELSIKHDVDPNEVVKVGDEVEVGQVLCIVEVMKLMNNIESKVAGTVKEILVDNEDAVEHGQPIMVIQPK
mgnify:CR=1 FL=1